MTSIRKDTKREKVSGYTCEVCGDSSDNDLILTQYTRIVDGGFSDPKTLILCFCCNEKIGYFIDAEG